MFRTLMIVFLALLCHIGQAFGQEATYTVRAGDTLSKIATAHQTTWQKLAAHNDLKNPNLIFPGQALRLASVKKVVTTSPKVSATAPNMETCTQAQTPYETGRASWYGNPYHGRKAASGETYNMHHMTVAHRTLPHHTMLCVTNTANGKSVVVRVNDRGPFTCYKMVRGKRVEYPVGPKDTCEHSRVLDLSYAAATHIGVTGVSPVVISVLEWPRTTNRGKGATAKLEQERKAQETLATQLPAPADLNRVHSASVEIFVGFYRQTQPDMSLDVARAKAHADIEDILKSLHQLSEEYPNP